MNKALKRLTRGALVAGMMLGSATAVHGQVAGRVNDIGGPPLEGATVEAWDTYPGGSILVSGISDINGDFALQLTGPASFDLRVHKTGFYPTVVRDLPRPISNVLVALSPLQSLLPTPTKADYWDTATTFLGSPIWAGDVVEARDPDDVLCGVSQFVPSAGQYLLHVRGDDGTTPNEDEGPGPGDIISFFLNGLPASPTAIWQALSNQQHNLTGTPDVPGVTVVGPPDIGGVPGQQTLVSYQVTNTGMITNTFNIAAAVDLGWTVSLITPTSTAITLSAGETAQVDVLIDVPGDAGTTTAVLELFAVSDTYQPAYSGAWTSIDVAPTGVGDGGSGGLLPDQFSLAQNYPNPFNPETQIAYNLRVGGHVRLEVFNLVGQSVAVLVDGYRPPGQGVVNWDGRNSHAELVPSGIYFYRLSQNGQSMTRKMVLLK